ncbi:hypothetical protein Cni_G22161 [Canna indica]|uniref:Uncharacterized protein n=1 Tax=Canna indica TaxID=4628 RepID=A0AAQ3KW95_9LILI|nr:hypothetical protein Cni_G22161 [Canna indica]
MELVLPTLVFEPSGKDDAVVGVKGVEATRAEGPAQELGVPDGAKEGSLLEVEITETEEALGRRCWIGCKRPRHR